MRRISLPLLLVFPLSAAAQAAQQNARPPAYVIRAAHLIDGRSDVVQNDVAIVVQGDRIVAVGRNAEEFAYMVRYGMSPMAAIKSATSVAAQLLDQGDNFGTVEAGKLADIIAVKGDPIADISELTRVSFVMKGGTIYKQ